MHALSFLPHWLGDKLAHHVIDIPPREAAHVVGREITDRVRQGDIGMPGHALGAKLKDGRVSEHLRKDGGGWNAALFKGNRVVHTAQRA